MSKEQELKRRLVKNGWLHGIAFATFGLTFVLLEEWISVAACALWVLCCVIDIIENNGE